MKLLSASILILVIALAGCTQKPAPVATESTPVTATERLAVAVEYVAVPTMNVYARPAEDAPVVGSYGFSEAVSVVEKKGDWSLVRTFDGNGWSKSKDMMTPEKSAEIDPLIPRFYHAPEVIPWRGRGELSYQARVNTDGLVIDVKLMKNTTGSEAIANANADALKNASFYPMVEKGMRKVFVYEHRVYY